MKDFEHVSNTWLIAVAAHPVVWFALVSYEDGLSDASYLIVIALLGLLFSSPAYLLCLNLFKPVRRIRADPFVKLALWLVIANVGIAVCSLLAALVFTQTLVLEVEVLQLGLPGMVAATFTILFRTKRFLKLVVNETPDFTEKSVGA